MGLTYSSTGKRISDGDFTFNKNAPLILLAGNPNVGKSTVFNALTGMHQHTGNWAGKTVSGAVGSYNYKGTEYTVADIPGAYSLYTVSREEEAARDLLLFGGGRAVIVVCDATCLERNLNLVLQIIEITPNVAVAVNLMDEAARKGIDVDVPRLSRLLGVPVVSLSALCGKGIEKLQESAASVLEKSPSPRAVTYPPAVESAAGMIEKVLEGRENIPLSKRWLALRILEDDKILLRELSRRLGFDLSSDKEISDTKHQADELLLSAGFTPHTLRRTIVSDIFKRAESICAETVCEDKCRVGKVSAADRFLTRGITGGAVMMLLLAVILFITVRGANAVSDFLFSLFSRMGDFLSAALLSISPPTWLHDAVIFGVWRVLSWVVSVMLPPMAIFFPFFTLLEDLGYLPRVAFLLDEPFRRCGTCGKQSLTMCMGFGCNAAGVTGCRIIDSPRERLIAMLTNSLVPCNGRFPILISLISVFFAAGSVGGSLISAFGLTVLILFGVGMTFLSSKILSKTLLKGLPSSMTLELPPFRRPQVGKILVRSLFDRTVFVLGRAVSAAAPAGLLIWLMANVSVSGSTLLSAVTDFLDPVGRFLGMDGVILAAFILGIPANEIVLPIIIMAYSSQTVLSTAELGSLHSVLAANGWTWRTALCVAVFAICHWPCATTLMTVRKESGSIRWTLAAFAVPTLCGVLICAALNFLFIMIS